jgi:hypothetical protein
MSALCESLKPPVGIMHLCIAYLHCCLLTPHTLPSLLPSLSPFHPFPSLSVLSALPHSFLILLPTLPSTVPTYLPLLLSAH